MIHQKLKWLSIYLITLYSFQIKAQSFSNIRAEFSDSKVIITYDLLGEADQLYRVELRSNYDDFKTPLRFVTGDIGPDISPAQGLRVIWDAAAELPEEFSDELQFKLVGESLTTRTVEEEGPTFLSPVGGTKWKKGREVELQWEGNSGGVLELYRFDSKISTIATVSGTSHKWTVPDEIKPGKGYEVRIGDAVKSESFTISRKLPLGFLIAPVVLTGVAVGVLISGESEGDANVLPAPPDPN